MGTVLLVRHAETAWNREGRVQGWAPTTLTARGHEQARVLANTLAGGAGRSGANVDRVISSDLRRARQTAQAVETVTGCRPTFDANWRERDMGRLRGLPTSELFQRYPQLSLEENGEDAARARPEGGETLMETRQRVTDAWDRLRADLTADETAVVISHSCPISLLLGHVQNDSLTRAVLDRTQDNGAVNELRVDGDDVRLVRENWTTYRSFATES